MGLYEKMGTDLEKIGGVLRCTACGSEEPVGGASTISLYLQVGWPRCCGLTKRWVTQKELNEEAAGEDMKCES